MRVQPEFVTVQKMRKTGQTKLTPTFIWQVPVLDQALLLLRLVLGSFTDTTRFRFELDRFGILAKLTPLLVWTTP